MHFYSGFTSLEQASEKKGELQSKAPVLFAYASVFLDVGCMLCLTKRKKNRSISLDLPEEC